MKIIFTSILVIVIGISCEEHIDYKYQNKEQVIDCQGVDTILLNEALYSFEDDLASYYNYSHEPGFLDYGYAYAKFIFNGALGNVDYDKIASNYTKKIFKQLLKEKDIWKNLSDESNINYKSEFVNCLIINIKNDDVKQTILSLRGVNSLNPKDLANVYRKNIRDAKTDKYFAMYLALDTYYNYLKELDSKEN